MHVCCRPRNSQNDRAQANGSYFHAEFKFFEVNSNASNLPSSFVNFQPIVEMVPLSKWFLCLGEQREILLPLQHDKVLLCATVHRVISKITKMCAFYPDLADLPSSR